MSRDSIAIPARLHRVPVLSARFRQWWDRQNSAFPTTSRDFSFCSVCCSAALSAAFCVPSDGFRSCCTKFRPKRSPPKAEAADLHKIRSSAFMVILMPLLIANDVGMGDPFFCKYLCPQGVLEGAIPLAAVNSGIRAALGALFFVEARYPDRGDRAERAFLPAVLQVAVSAGRFLCAA